MKFSKFFLVFILSFILFFSTSVSCYASDTNSDNLDSTGFNSWSLDEKVHYVDLNIVDFFTSFTGLLNGDTTEYRKWLLDYYARYPEAGVDNFYEYVANGLSFDDDTQTWELSDYLVEFCNSIVVDYNDRVTMVYRYPLNKANIDASKFPNKVVFDAFVDLLDAFPDCYFYFNSSDCQNPNFIIDGVRNNFGAAYRVQVVKPFSGVNAYPDLVTTPVTFYGENWEVSPMSLFWIVSSDEFKTADNISYFELTNFDNYNNMNYGNYYSNLNDLKSAGFSFSSGSCASLSMCNKFSWSRTFTDYYTPYSASNVPINVYKTVADMKKDIGSQVIGSYTDTYTGTPVQTITQSEINNIINNYYPSDPDDDSGGGSGSGSDDSGGSSSGGSGIIDGLGKLFGSIGNIIDKLFGFVLGLLSKVVDFFGSILEMFTETLTKLIDIIPSGFNEFLAAMFPYIPEEWITIAEFILLVSAIGCVVALFKR